MGCILLLWLPMAFTGVNFLFLFLYYILFYFISYYFLFFSFLLPSFSFQSFPTFIISNNFTLIMNSNPAELIYSLDYSGTFPSLFFIYFYYLFIYSIFFFLTVFYFILFYFILFLFILLYFIYIYSFTHLFSSVTAEAVIFEGLQVTFTAFTITGSMVQRFNVSASFITQPNG
jgi:hypothetical protein